MEHPTVSTRSPADSHPLLTKDSRTHFRPHLIQTSSHSVPDVSPPGNTRFPRPSISACISQSSPSARASSASFPAAPGPTRATLVLLAMTHSQCFTYMPTHSGTWGRAHVVSCLLIANVAQEHTQLLAATHTAAGSHINTHTHTSHKSHHRHTHSLTPGHCHMLCATRAHSLGDTLAAKCVGHGGCRARGLGTHPQVPEERGTAAIVPPQRVGAAGALPADLVAEAGFSPRQAPRRHGALAATATARGEEGLEERERTPHLGIPSPIPLTHSCRQPPWCRALPWKLGPQWAQPGPWLWC